MDEIMESDKEPDPPKPSAGLLSSNDFPLQFIVIRKIIVMFEEGFRAFKYPHGVFTGLAKDVNSR